MKKYSIDLSFDPPMMEGHQFVHMNIESPSKASLEWLLGLIEKSGDLYHNCFLVCKMEEDECDDEDS
jgi:hypothetical protein